MSAEHPVFCGITGRPLAAGDTLQNVRVTKEDLAAAGIVPFQPHNIEGGHFQAASSTVEVLKPFIVERLKKTPKVDHNGHAVFVDDAGERVHDGTGKRAMVLPADATPASVSRDMLV